MAVGATCPSEGCSSTIRAWIRSETRPFAAGGLRSGSRTRIAAIARRPSANRTISRSDRRRPELGGGALASGWTGVGSTIIGGSLPSEVVGQRIWAPGSGPARDLRRFDRTVVLVNDSLVNASAASQVRASQTFAPATRQALRTASLRFRASCAPSGPAGRRRTQIRATPENHQGTNAFQIHDPIDLGACRVDPPDAPAVQRIGRQRPHLLLDERLRQLPRARLHRRPGHVPRLRLPPTAELTPLSGTGAPVAAHPPFRSAAPNEQRQAADA